MEAWIHCMHARAHTRGRARKRSHNCLNEGVQGRAHKLNAFCEWVPVGGDFVG